MSQKKEGSKPFASDHFEVKSLDVEFELGSVGEPDLARVAAGRRVDDLDRHSSVSCQCD